MIVVDLWYVWIGILIYLCIGWAYASMYMYECKNNIETEYEPGAYYVALFLWLAVLIYSWFDRSEK